MQPFPEINPLELGQRHAAVEILILRNLLIGLERPLPGGFIERGQGALDRFPIRDRKPGLKYPERCAL